MALVLALTFVIWESVAVPEACTIERKDSAVRATCETVEMTTEKSDLDPRTAGYQRWTNLTFLHWRVPAETLQTLLPKGLRIQQFDGSAWLGVVPFSMECVRPWWSPPVPGLSWFLETNVRTYVVDERGVAGVWFFSLDADNWMAVNVARTFWHLPYLLANMTLELHSSRRTVGPESIQYTGVRKESPAAEYEVKVDLPDLEPQPAKPDSLDYFLVERYLLFAMDHKQRLRTGRVHHAPYQIIRPTSVVGSQSLTNTIGCVGLDIANVDHVAFCTGVDVRVSPLRNSSRTSTGDT
jgi:uncharacterized protein YqjF (DUF2071 family)